MPRVEPEEVHQLWLAAMRRGDFLGAWQQTDRLEKDRSQVQPWHLRWDGSSFTGKRVLVYCEHGLGDTLQNVRFIRDIARIAHSVTTRVQPSLLDLLTSSTDLGKIENGWTTEPPPEHDVAIECTELAYAFRIEVNDLPGNVPYLNVSRILERSDKFNFSGAEPRKSVGLVWAASGWDSSRSLPVQALDSLGNVRGCDFFSLQQGSEADGWREIPWKIQPLHERTQDIRSAAAVMLALDLVITVDTMAAHLAGALGVPVWLILKKEADWRWLEGRSDSPWYPTMRLFRQQEGNHWRAVVEQVAGALQHWCDGDQSALPAAGDLRLSSAPLMTETGL